MIILGIDGSLTATGLSLIQTDTSVAPHIVWECCVRTEPAKRQQRIYAADDDGRRIDEIASAIDGAVRRASWVAIEAPAGAQSAVAAKALGLVYGCSRAIAVVHRRPVLVVQAGEAKRLATGDRDASKARMVEWAEGWGGRIVATTKPAREAIADARALVYAATKSAIVRVA
jgi:Holliday junction resolvasome RuvABC endonuclease subunit